MVVHRNLRQSRSDFSSLIYLKDYTIEVAPCVGLELVTIQSSLRESHGYEVSTHNLINQLYIYLSVNYGCIVFIFSYNGGGVYTEYQNNKVRKR